MCGFAGYCTLTSQHFFADQELLSQLGNVLIHRGPDGSGEWVDHKHQVALVHRRLRIVDLSDAAAQPMMDQEKSVVVVFNGEIYNYQELRSELNKLWY